MFFRKLNNSKTTLVLIGVVLFLVLQNLKFHKDDWKTSLGADARGYYAYLPALFIYQDANMSFFEELDKKKYYDKNLYYDYRSSDGRGNVISKYYVGTAVAQLPFFLIAHGIAHFNADDIDGYSRVYMIWVLISGWFYCLVGLFFFRRLMQLYKFREAVQSLTLVLVVFATNLFYYSVVEATISHVYSFAFISLFLFYSKRFFQTKNSKYLLHLGLFLGIIVLIRPVNGLIVFSLPFFASRWSVLTEGIKVVLTSRNTLWGVFLFFAIISIQLIYYKVATGSFLVYSYGGEGFNFLSPHFVDILFSYRKGLFLYTPFYFLAFLMVFILWKKSRYLLVSWLVFFTLLTYVFSSWWMWYYGGSFSGRVFVEFIPFLLFPFALGLNEVYTREKWKIGIISLSFLLLVLCQIQTFQYRYEEIHWSEMNKEKYWRNFLRIDKLL